MNDSTTEQNPKSWWNRLSSGLKRSSSSIGTAISDLVTRRRLDNAALDEIEEALLRADLGVATAARISDVIGQGRYAQNPDADALKAIIAQEVEKALLPVAHPLKIEGARPFVILVAGVNGSGKTTTIGKLASKFAQDGRKVMLAAGDTFRAAAIEQLKIWGERTGSAVVAKETGADAASLAFDALRQARDESRDIVIIDTAGRLQNKVGLMAELEKIVRVLKKQDENLPHAVLLVLDATTGQNAHSQVKTFKEAVDVSGLIVTKLDGSARGGVVVSLAKEFGLPIHAIGVGEKESDLSPFRADDFARALMGLPA